MLVDFDGVLFIDELAGLLRISPRELRQMVKRGTFPIPTMPAINRHLRWWGPTVHAWLVHNAEAALVAAATMPAVEQEPLDPLAEPLELPPDEITDESEAT
jgi:hypothetical protein